MDSLSLASLALQLLASVHAYSGYPATKSLPEIHQAPLAEIQQRFCRSTCYAQAFYRLGEGVYIGEAFDLANDEFARSVLLHELAHVRRHDYVVNILQTLVETLLFYHPAIWWLSREIRIEREHCCDDLVLESLKNRADYCRELLAVEELRGQNRTPLLALGATEG